MAGYENIRDANNNRTPEERRELAKIAGKASGKARRRKANFQKTLNLLLTAEIDNEEWKPILESLGVECTLESALLTVMWNPFTTIMRRQCSVIPSEMQWKRDSLG